MICISLSPPYATLIALLLKRIETRSWSTAHRGLLGIHQTAAPGPKGTTEATLIDLCTSDPFFGALIDAGYRGGMRLPRGKIVAVVDLMNCLPTAGPRVNGSGPKYADWVHELSDMERAFGDYSPGRYGWKLANVRALAEPVSARGMPGLWQCSAAVAAAVAAQIGQVPS
jgi:activating signal cointegrator 1